MKKLLIAMLALATLIAPIALASPASATTPRVQLAISRTIVATGQGFTLTATARRAAPRQKAVLQQRVGAKWTKVAVKYLPRKGKIKRVSFVRSLNTTGYVTFRVVLLAKGRYSAAKSSQRSVQVVTKAPLRFNFSGARALALRQRTSGARVASGARMMTTTDGSASNLSTVSGSGTTTDAVVSGNASVSHFLIAPTGDVFVAFSRAVDLSDTSAFVPVGAGCVLAKVDAVTGVPTCIDTTMWSLDWKNNTPPIQFDASGAVYYSGQTMTSPDVLRRYNGTSTDLINDNMYLSDFLVTADGTVLVSGSTTSTGAIWTRRISPSGGLQTLLNSQSSFAHMPDGGDYAVSGNTVYRFQADATPQLQASSWSSDPSPCWNLCYDIHKRAVTSDGRVFLIGSGGGSNSAQITQTYPSTQPITLTTVQTPTRLTAVGTQVLIAGRNSAGVNVLSQYDPATGTERALTDATHELEVYHLDASDGTTAMFDGLRFSDNTLVVGKVDVTTGQVTVLNSLTSKWEDFQTF